MKKLFLFLAMASTTMFVSCGSDDSDNTTNPPVEATSITVTASATSVELGQPITFTVKNNLNADVTSSSTFTANNVAFNGPSFTAAAAGTFTIVAKNGVLTSPAVTVTITEPVAVPGENSIFINGENNAVTNSILVLWSGYNEDPNAEVATHGLFSMLTFDNETGAKTGNYIDVEFIVPLDAEGNLVFPTPANSEYLDIYEVVVDGADVEITSQEGGSLTLADFPDAINMPHAFSATCDYNSGSNLSVDFDGNWLGFSDQTAARPAAAKAKKTLANASKKVLSRSQVLKNKAKFFASLKK